MKILIDNSFIRLPIKRLLSLLLILSVAVAGKTSATPTTPLSVNSTNSKSPSTPAVITSSTIGKSSPPTKTATSKNTSSSSAAAAATSPILTTTTTELITSAPDDTTTTEYYTTTTEKATTNTPETSTALTTKGKAATSILTKSKATTHTNKQTTQSAVPNVSQTIKMSTTEHEISTTEVYNDNSTDPANSTEANTTDSKTTNLVTATSSLEYLAVNGTCRLGFYLHVKNGRCVYLCKDKVCQNGGECAVVTDKAICRCKQDDDVEYSGDNCEVSKTSQLKERKITLGILIPLMCILLLALICTCVKLKRLGKAARDPKNNYELNSGTL